ncbi:MAG: hypothetical protein ACRD4I_09575 [Candidatus Angelobacter sp.]
MRKALVLIIVLLIAGMAGWAQGPPQEQAPAAPHRQQAQVDLNMILAQIQRVALAATGDIGKLRIEKWKTDGDQKQQLQKVADSLQRNITYAIPGLLMDVRNTHGNVSTTFKLYHNLNVLYEFLSSLADAAGGLGKKEEYEPLAADAAALDEARTNLSTYIEQTAAAYEARVRASSASAGQAAPPPRKIIIDDLPAKPVKKTKKKSSKSTHRAAPTPSPSPSCSPK